MQNSRCPCLYDLSAYGLTGNLIADINGRAYNMGPTYGLRTCAAHDNGTAPFCNGADPPVWCYETWCYIDPAACAANISIELSSYFDRAAVYYSTDTCGSGADDFNPWYEAAGDIGDACKISAECFGAQAVCDSNTHKCGCRASFGTTGPDCLQFTPNTAWAFMGICGTALVYLFSTAYLLWVSIASSLARNQCCGSLAVGCGFLSSIIILFGHSYKLMALLGLGDKLSYALVTNLSESIGASAGIISYCTLSVGWLNLLVASRRFDRIDHRRLRTSRRAVYAFTMAFLLATLVNAGTRSPPSQLSSHACPWRPP